MNKDIQSVEAAIKVYDGAAELYELAQYIDNVVGIELVETSSLENDLHQFTVASYEGSGCVHDYELIFEFSNMTNAMIFADFATARFEFNKRVMAACGLIYQQLHTTEQAA
jgi:hypothetical protein